MELRKTNRALNHCFLCCREITKFQDRKKSLIKDQVTTVFLVFKLLKVPYERFSNFLTCKGNPTSWFSFCSKCRLLVKESEHIFMQILKLKSKLNESQRKIEEFIKDNYNESVSKSAIRHGYDVRRVIRAEVVNRLNEESSTNDGNGQTESSINVDIKKEITVEEPEWDDDNGFDLPCNDDYGADSDNPGINSNSNDEEANCEGDEIENSNENTAEPEPVMVNGVFTCGNCGKQFKVIAPYKKHCIMCPIPSEGRRKHANIGFVHCINPKNDSVELQTRKTRSGNRYKYELTAEQLRDAYNRDSGRVIIPIKKNYIKEGEFDENYTHECLVCKRKYETDEMLVKHCLHSHGIEFGVEEKDLTFLCLECPEKFSTEGLLRAHTRGIHNGEDKPFQCNVCRRSYFSYYGYFKHCEEAHLVDGPVICNQCSAHFYNEDFLKIHIWRTHDGDTRPYKCPICLQGFVHDLNLRWHRRLHFLGKQFVCEYCSSSFLTEKHLERHQFRDHKQELGLPPIQCDICKKNFGDNELLRMHLKSTHDEKKFMFSCTHCKRGRYQSQERLEAHMKAYHSHEKNFKCPDCRRRFRLNKQLTKHQLQEHSGRPREKPHVCPTCNEAFTYKKKLRIHLAKVHNNKPFECPVCQRMFGFKQYLRKHVRIMHDMQDIPPGAQHPKNVSNVELETETHKNSSGRFKKCRKSKPKQFLQPNRDVADQPNSFYSQEQRKTFEETNTNNNLNNLTPSIIQPSNFTPQTNALTCPQSGSIPLPQNYQQFFQLQQPNFGDQTLSWRF